MHSDVGITSRSWFSFNNAPKLHIGYFETTLHVGITFKFGPSLNVLLKSPMGYFKMNLNTAIAFRVMVSYSFAISTHVLIFTN
jgi:hypothetical protein